MKICFLKTYLNFQILLVFGNLLSLTISLLVTLLIKELFLSFPLRLLLAMLGKTSCVFEL